MSEKLCLKWNDFQENVKTAFGNLREDKHFTDVTLACEDGQQLEAHKVILAASSPFFQKLLEWNKHPHPLIYMRGLKSEELLAILDFLYFGEINVLQEKLESFLALAEELQLNFTNNQIGTNLEDLNEKIKTMMTTTARSADGKYIATCNICGKEATAGNLPNHIEANHIIGVSYPCHICGKVSKSRNALRMHKNRDH